MIFSACFLSSRPILTLSVTVSPRTLQRLLLDFGFLKRTQRYPVSLQFLFLSSVVAYVQVHEGEEKSFFCVVTLSISNKYERIPKV